ncbi:hypothetical protein DH2020_007670 [Rehmannia glutinosa]|uniref:Uncharacterized protein n=1 Tax=Rehmannia glutinosa TaxID=99300 RepID=A0ABR0TYU4_REHGL
MNWILNILITLIFFSSWIKAQQKYSGNAVFDCKNTDDETAFHHYTCNGKYPSCKAYLIFTAKFPYNTVPVISALTSSDQTETAKINNVTMFTVFPTGQEVIIPVNCSCSNQHYEAITTYQVPVERESYYTIANDTYQGLSTCDSIRRANIYSEPGNKLRVPLRCACPTSEQAASGTKFLLTYTIGQGDTVYALSKRFNVSVTNMSEANGVSDEFPIIYPYTTILIPLPNEPSTSQTISRGYNTVNLSPLPPPVVVKNRSKSVLSTAGIAGGALSMIIFLLLVLVFLFRKKRTQVPQIRGRNANMSSPKDLILEIAKFDRTLKVFKFSEIKKATGNFGSKNRIKGCVYVGTFRKQVLAVKKKNCGNWENEVKMLHQINHINIVKLDGFCQHNDETYLVYEYMKNGSLQEWLSRRESKDVLIKSWNELIRIALDVANGLLYLHNFTNPGYVHNNITSSNILLDGNFRAKIANFSLATTPNCHVITRVAGSKGYMAPECLDAGPITPKVDVFAFGVILLELISGKCPVYEQDGRERLLSITIDDIMESHNAETELTHFIVPGLEGHGGIGFALQVVKLSLSCLRQDPADRPDMVEVVSVLLKLQLNINKLVCGERNKMASCKENENTSFSSSFVI